tara:strand:- start:167 stop:460 length:294 start_codon:yes stop_codon:yes gene_type:complete
MSVQTVYEAYKPASEYLMEYYTWIDILDIERREFNEHAESIEKHCKELYKKFEKAAAQEKRREENSKSARIARKLEQMRMTDDLVNKIKLRQELKKK